MSLSLRVINADIQTAENNISPAINPTNDEMLYNIAAYHAQQAVEKCLKLILIHYYGIGENERRMKTHNIAGLIGQLEDCATADRPLPIDIPEIIYTMSAEITIWEASSRYNDDIVILRDNIRHVLAACRDMSAALQRTGLQ